jgi:hypothetical protein
MTMLDPNGCPSTAAATARLIRRPQVTHRIPGLNEQGHDAIEHHNP